VNVLLLLMVLAVAFAAVLAMPTGDQSQGKLVEAQRVSVSSQKIPVRISGAANLDSKD
jgi:hypothetical protein